MVARPLCGAPEGVPVTMGYVLTAKAIFEKQFTINHSKDLDKANIQCRLKNLSLLENKGSSTGAGTALSSHSGRLYFNKTVLPLGQIFIRVGDTIELQFYVEDPFSDLDAKDKEPQPFSYATFLVTERGFETVKGMSHDERITDVVTWKAFMTTLNFNNIHDSSQGLTSLSHNQQQAKIAAMKAHQATNPTLSKTAMPVLNPLKTLKTSFSPEA